MNSTTYKQLVQVFPLNKRDVTPIFVATYNAISGIERGCIEEQREENSEHSFRAKLRHLLY